MFAKKLDVRNILIFALLVGLIFAGSYRYGQNSKDVATSIPILTYHRICTEQEYRETSLEERDLWVIDTDFETQMKWLHDNGYTTLSLDEFYDWYTGKIELPKKVVVITFDDGCKNVTDYALPILKKYNMKATMFVIGAHVKEYPYTLDKLTYVSTRTIAKVEKEYPNFQFESHTYDLHYFDENTDTAAIFDSNVTDILHDFQKMDKNVSSEFKYIAYPYGYYTASLIQSAQKCNYKLGFTYNDQVKATRDDNAFLIPRIGIRGDETIEKAFIAYLQ